MKYADARAFALALPDASEAPHFKYNSFRVSGKIFVTVPPEETHLHVFVDEEAREQALALYPKSCEKLMWGEKACGLRINLSVAKPALVKQLIEQAHLSKYRAPKARRGSA